MRSKYAYERIDAAREAVRFGKDAHAVVDPLIELTRDADPVARMTAITAIDSIDDRSPETIAALLNALADSDRNVQTQALYALAKIGAPALNGLKQLVRDKEKGEKAKEILFLLPHKAGILVRALDGVE